MATGAGRTHLLLGQIGDEAVPASAAGELYALTAGYGGAAGLDATLVVESPDLAPLGDLGRLRPRLFSCPVEYDAACRLRFTPVVDYMRSLPATVTTLAAPAARQTTAVQVRMLAACTTVRLRVEVLERAGPVNVFTPMLHYSPITAVSKVAMGETP